MQVVLKVEFFLWLYIFCGIIGDSAEQRGTTTGATTGKERPGIKTKVDTYTYTNILSLLRLYEAKKKTISSRDIRKV